jgi:hypothetical protein
MKPWPSDPKSAETCRGESFPLPLHPDDPPPWVASAEQLAAWRGLPEFEGLDPDA